MALRLLLTLYALILAINGATLHPRQNACSGQEKPFVLTAESTPNTYATHGANKGGYCPKNKYCGVFFSVNETSGTPFQINGRNQLVVASTAPFNFANRIAAPANSYGAISLEDPTVYKAGAFKHMMCEVQEGSGGECNLACNITGKPEPFSLGGNNQWYIKSRLHTPQTSVQVVFTDS